MLLLNVLCLAFKQGLGTLTFPRVELPVSYLCFAVSLYSRLIKKGGASSFSILYTIVVMCRSHLCLTLSQFILCSISVTWLLGSNCSIILAPRFCSFCSLWQIHTGQDYITKVKHGEHLVHCTAFWLCLTFCNTPLVFENVWKDS